MEKEVTQNLKHYRVGKLVAEQKRKSGNEELVGNCKVSNFRSSVRCNVGCNSSLVGTAE